MDCIFCNIINKTMSANIVYEDEYVMAFDDIKKESPVHILIVPKKHIKSLNDINEKNIEYINRIFLAIPKIAKIVNIDITGYRVISNTGVDANQAVKHLHFHLLGGKNLGNKIVS
ncbi:MAG: histidine triad nucleotide-binding protein [Clostridia bacterium]